MYKKATIIAQPMQCNEMKLILKSGNPKRLMRPQRGGGGSNEKDPFP